MINKGELDQLKVTFFGSGTSSGVPVIGCNCDVCLSSDPRHKRLRSSILLEHAAWSLPVLIDTGPDFRAQMLRSGISTLQAVLYTHLHADHVHGIDDLRALSFFDSTPLDVLLPAPMKPELLRRFGYIFGEGRAAGYRGALPNLSLKTFEPGEVIEVGAVRFETFLLPHGHTQSVAYKIKDFLFATDFAYFPEDLKQSLRGRVRVMVASGVPLQPGHAAHSSVLQTRDLMLELGVEQGLITHLSHEVDYRRHRDLLPAHIEFAYDQLCMVYDLGIR